MPEKEPQVTFIDRRKISSDGEIRPEAAELRKETPEAAAAPQAPPPPAAGPQAVDTTSPNNESADEQPAGPTREETEQSHAAYRETTDKIDDLLREKSPDAARMGPVGFEHLVQSMYMTAMMALGAGTQPGEKPRIDLMGARQTIDLLAVLDEKTKGNLTADEQRLLESALFELRMTFLEITNAIARQAANPPQGKPQPKRS
jgi:hypothetical protein